MPLIRSLLHNTSTRTAHLLLCDIFCYKPKRSANESVATLCTTSGIQFGANKNRDVVLPAVPQDCCMSGCANCVWIKYAEEIVKLLDDGGEVAKQKIFEHVKDPNLRAFLMIELDDVFKKGGER